MLVINDNACSTSNFKPGLVVQNGQDASLCIDQTHDV